MTENLLAETEAAMRRLGQPRMIEPTIDAKTVAIFIQSLIENKVPSEMIKDLACTYLMKL